MTFTELETQLKMMLKDQPRGTAADLTDWAAAYWDGCQLVGVWRRADGSERLDEEFDLDEHWYGQHETEIMQWLAHPKYSAPVDLLEWLDDSPPCEAG